MRQLPEEKFNKRRLISTYFSVVVSISLVLFLTGIIGILLVNSKKVADHFKEQIVMTIYLRDSAKEIELKQLQKTLRLNTATKKVIYVSKEEASQRHANEIGEDFMEFLGYNPLLNSIDVYFKASFLNPAVVSKLSKDIALYSYVNEVVYDRPLLELLDENIKKITFWMLLASGIFIIVAVLLINSSIRLSIYSKRLIIKTMQLVGATKSFIRRPFIKTHLLMSTLGAIIAMSGMALVLYEMEKRFPELQIFEHPLEPALVFVGVFILGLGITIISTFFATQRYLNLKSDAVN
ncbi:MAG: FtsX-like permease family protein [Flavobacteriaceae bacterium TMED42]|nr:MAG: FtsX-like permease family protein [Flavobacteriaceae bacterium TMED42]|tara:strand:+ start:3635 stop:4513 length:879 start_codon:yes stop_codon:yes gene_type:complete